VRATHGRAGDDDASWVPDWSAPEIRERWEALLARVLEDELEDELSPPPQLAVIQGGRDL
jgi:hypothetical protein